MLTIKNLVRKKTCIFLTLAALLTGCAPPGPRALIEGKRMLEQGRYASAIEKLKIATSLLSSNALAWDYLGLACHHAGLPLEAERAYQRALFYDRDLTEAHYNLGCLWFEQNKLDGARLDLTAFTLRQGNSLQGLLKLGSVQLRLRDPGAEKSFSEALLVSPQNLEALNGLGLARAQRGRFAEAAARFNGVLKIQPGYAPALLNLAILSQVYLRDRPTAAQKYREYLALQPPAPNAEAVATTLRQLEAEMSPVVRPPAPAVAPEVPPPAPHPAATNASPVTNLVRILPPPRPEPAVSIAPKPVAVPPPVKPSPALISPSIPAAAPKTAAVVVAKSVPPPPLAAAVPAPVVVDPPAPAPLPARAPNSGSRYPYLSPARPAPGNRAEAKLALARGVAAQEARQFDEAMKEYESAAESDPAFFEAYYNLGIAATQAGKLPQALGAYEYALAIDPDSANARYNLALCLKQARYLPDALNELEKLLARSPHETRAHLAIANIYALSLNQPDKARPHYQKVIEIDPQDPQAATIRNWLNANSR